MAYRQSIIWDDGRKKNTMANEHHDYIESDPAEYGESAQVQREFMLLDELLTDRERAFVEAVYRTPDCKYPGGDAIWDTVDITENDVTVWLKPEQLGLVVCTGTYKWKPTERLCLGCTV